MHKIRRTLATLAALSLAAGLASSALAEDESQPLGVYEIEGLTWLLTSQTVDGELTDIPGMVNVSLRMEDGRAGGSAGCNSYFTTYEKDGFGLSFGEIGSTLMACLPTVMDIEAAYIANLGSVASYQSGGIEMAMMNADGEFILEFALAPAATVVGAWVATGINNQLGENAGVVNSEITSLVTASFSPDGDLTGFDGCNDYFTSYVVEGDTIAVAPEIGQTRMACPSEELTEQAEWYYGALAAATSWRIDDNGELELRDDEGALQVSFTTAE